LTGPLQTGFVPNRAPGGIVRSTKVVPLITGLRLVLLLVDFEKDFGRHARAVARRQVCVFFYFFYFVSLGVPLAVSLGVLRRIVCLVIADNKVSSLPYRCSRNLVRNAG
jgi:hypothetical protein